MNRVIYSGYFIDNPEALLAKIPPRLKGEGVTIHAHHVTKAFQPQDGLRGVELGRKRTLRATSEVVTDELHVVLVEATDGVIASANQYPHVTIATAPGVPPGKSNQVIAQAVQSGAALPVNPAVEFETIEGYFNGERVVTS